MCVQECPKWNEESGRLVKHLVSSFIIASAHCALNTDKLTATLWNHAEKESSSMGDYVMYGISADSIGLVINCPHWCLGLVVRATKPVRSVAVMGPHEPNAGLWFNCVVQRHNLAIIIIICYFLSQLSTTVYSNVGQISFNYRSDLNGPWQGDTHTHTCYTLILHNLGVSYYALSLHS